ncbi:MAG TPA: hypothetical protein VG518_06210 [Solirubrobacterales bacterium]|nr:hypothetical protein [Solirubrobacterales bacterium]
MNEPRDRGAYRLAVGGIGAALVVLLLGICLVLAFGEGASCDAGCTSSPPIPSELWTLASGLAGGLLGLLAPAPTTSTLQDRKAKAGASSKKPEETNEPNAAKVALTDLGENRTVGALLVVFVLSVAVGAISGSTELHSLSAASGAALLGLLVPTPASSDTG